VILSVLRTSWSLLRRDRAAWALSFVVPVLFFSIFAVIFGGQRSAGTRKVRLLVADEDRSERSARLVRLLAAESALDVRTAPDGGEAGAPPQPFTRASVETAVRGGDAAVALVVPAGFGAARIGFGPGEGRATLELLADSSDPIASQVAAGLLQKVAFTGMSDLFLETGIEQLDAVAGFDADQRERLRELLAEVRRDPPQPGARSGEEAPSGPIAIETRDLLGESKKNPMIAFYAAGMGVMFLLFSAAGAGGR